MNAAASVRSRSAAGRRGGERDERTSQPKTFSVRDPTSEPAFRRSRSPARPCSRFPANVPMSETPAPGRK